MTTEKQIEFYQEEKFKFDQLLQKFGWDEESLFNEGDDPLKKIEQCPFDRNHRFPKGSKHLHNCQLINEGFSKDYSVSEKCFRRKVFPIILL